MVDDLFTSWSSHSTSEPTTMSALTKSDQPTEWTTCTLSVRPSGPRLPNRVTSKRSSVAPVKQQCGGYASLGSTTSSSHLSWHAAIAALKHAAASSLLTTLSRTHAMSAVWQAGPSTDRYAVAAEAVAWSP